MRETSEENRFQERTAVMGWRTDKKTKPVIVNNLAKAIREGDIIDLDVVFLAECQTYVIDDQGHTNAQEGQFDDTVMAKAIALQMAEYSGIDVANLKEKITKPVKRNKNATSSTSNLDSIARPGATRPAHREAVERRRAARAVHRQRRSLR
jgi:23S rRNA maturation mini-RNase III